MITRSPRDELLLIRCFSDTLTKVEFANSITLQGRYAEAEPLYERSQAIREQTMGHGHPAVAVVLNNRANLKKAQV